MFILGDESKINGKISWVTFFLVAVNVAVFSAEIYWGEPVIQGFTLVPKEISTLKAVVPTSLGSKRDAVALQDRSGRQVAPNTSGGIRVYEYTAPVGGRGMSLGPVRILLTLLTCMFLHASWLHLIGNMWFLALFGRNVEGALGHLRYLIFYLACGVASALVYTLSDSSSIIQYLGASGAISGIMGAYFAIMPFNRILVYLGPFGIVPLPASWSSVSGLFSSIYQRWNRSEFPLQARATSLTGPMLAASWRELSLCGLW